MVNFFFSSQVTPFLAFTFFLSNVIFNMKPHFQTKAMAFFINSTGLITDSYCIHNELHYYQPVFNCCLVQFNNKDLDSLFSSYRRVHRWHGNFHHHIDTKHAKTYTVLFVCECVCLLENKLNRVLPILWAISRCWAYYRCRDYPYRLEVPMCQEKIRLSVCHFRYITFSGEISPFSSASAIILNPILKPKDLKSITRRNRTSR